MNVAITNRRRGFVLTSAILLAAGAALAAEGTEEPAAHADANSAAVHAKDANQPAKPITWMAWGPEAFALAKKESKGILLNIVAPGCAPCAAMDGDVWTDPKVEKAVERLWVPVRVEQDDRPDITSRYLAALSILNPTRRGIPVTAFLFPTGEAMWADSYIPAETVGKRPGLRSLLVSLDGFWKRRFEEARKNVLKVQGWYDWVAEAKASAPLSGEVLSSIIDGIAQSADKVNGGFGPPPRTANPFCVRAVLDAAEHRGDSGLRDQALRALKAPILGAQFDLLEGGFHFPPQTAEWSVPAFGKFLAVNAGYLSSLAEALRFENDKVLAETAGRTIDYLLGTLVSPEGGFYVRQLGAVDPTDPYTYYAWKMDELERALGEKDMAWAKLVFGVERNGNPLLGLPPRTTLLGIAAQGAPAGMSAADAQAARERIAGKLRELHGGTLEPPIVNARYVDSTALAVSALLDAGAVLHRKDATDAALRALDEVLAENPELDRGVPHRLGAPKKGHSPVLLADLAYLGNALLDAYEFSGQPKYLEAAKQAAGGLHGLFEDEAGGGFYDVPKLGDALGYLRLRLKPIRDSYLPSPNADAARFLDALARVTGEPSWGKGAEAALESASGRLKPYGPPAATTAIAMAAHLEPAVKITVSGRGPGARNLVEAAWRLQAPARVIAFAPEGAGGDPTARVCVGTSCGDAVKDPDRLADELRRVRKMASNRAPSIAAP